MRPAPPPARPAGVVVPLVLAAILLAARLAWPRYTPFLVDEPKLQALIDAAAARHRVPAQGLAGSQPIPYGPTAAWIYALVRVASDSYPALVLATALLHAGAIVLFFFVLRRVFGAAAAAWATLLAASSPFLAMYGRVAWDNTFLVPLAVAIFAAVAWLVPVPGRGGSPADARAWVALALASALAVGTHLMVVPLVASAYAVAAALLARSAAPPRRKLACAAIGLVVPPLVLAPYLAVVARHVAAGTASRVAGEHAFGQLGTILAWTTSALSPWGFAPYFFRGSTAAFEASLGAAAPLFAGPDPTWMLRAPLLAVVLGAPIAIAARRRAGPAGWLLVLSGATIAGAALLYASTGLFGRPHYYHYLAFAPLVALAACLASERRGVALALRWACALAVAVNVVFLAAAARFVATSEGTRGDGFGAVAASQERVVGEMCRAMRTAGREAASVDLSRVAVSPAALGYFFRRDRACDGLVLAVGPGDFSLAYPADGASARLVLGTSPR